ncbi:MAG: RluA family pseudouridine synthase [Aureliella sp.]
MPKKHSSSQPFTLFHLQPEHEGQTLAGALKLVVPDCSWGKAQQWIQQRQVQVNGNLCMDPARRVTGKDVLKLWNQPLAKPVTAEQLRLPYVDEHLLVVEKPAGITSVWHQAERRMPARRRELQPTLEEMLPAAIAKAIGPPRSLRPRGPAKGRRQKGPPERWPVFAVHRLDRDTSGLMLFARTRIAEQKLVSMFRGHRIQRQYWAVATGHVQSQTVRSYLVRDRGDGLRGSAPLAGPSDAEAASQAFDKPTAPTRTGAEGQLAITHVELREALGNYSIVRCRLETGRTHQIRIHLAELGHPLCGEKTYTRLTDGTTLVDVSDAPRQALHAERLAFTHPLTGEQLDFHMPLPTDLKRWLQRLRSSVERSDPTRKSSEEEE